MADAVEIPFANAEEQAVLLLAAAENLGYDPGVVRTTEGGFVAPQDVHDKAFPPAKSRKKKSESELVTPEGGA